MSPRKYLSATLPSIEIAWIRFLVFALIMSPRMVPVRRCMPCARSGPDCRRCAAVALLGLRCSSSPACGFFRSQRPPLPVFVAPLFVHGAVDCFSRRDRRRTALACEPRSGLIGVLIILRPGTGAFHPAAFFPIVSAAGLGLYINHDAHDERKGSRITTMTYSSIVGVCILSALVRSFGSPRAGTIFCSASSSPCLDRRAVDLSFSPFVTPMPPCSHRFRIPNCCGSASSVS